MKVELSHRTEWVPHEVDAQNIATAAYMAIRQTHDFLTDDNHTWDAGERDTHWGGKPIKFTSVRIYRNAKSEAEWPYTGPPALATDYWFSVEYRPVVNGDSKP